MGGALARQAAALAQEEERHARELDRRTADLERHHAELAEAERRRHAVAEAALAAAVQELEVRVLELEAAAEAAEVAARAAALAGAAAAASRAVARAEAKAAELLTANEALRAELAKLEETVTGLREARVRQDVAVQDLRRTYQVLLGRPASTPLGGAYLAPALSPHPDRKRRGVRWGCCGALGVNGMASWAPMAAAVCMA